MVEVQCLLAIRVPDLVVVDWPCTNVSAYGWWFKCSSKSKCKFSPVLLIFLLRTSQAVLRDYVLVRPPYKFRYTYLVHYVDYTVYLVITFC